MKLKKETENQPTIEFKGHDVYLFASVLVKIGMTTYLTSMDDSVDDKLTKKERQTKKGQELLNLIFANMGAAEPEINKLIESVTGMSNVSALPFREYQKAYDTVFESKDFNDFFQSAFQLAMKLTVA